MGQENPFPDFVPKVKDVVRISKIAGVKRIVREAVVVERQQHRDGVKRAHTYSVVVRVADGMTRNPQELVGLQYTWSVDDSCWYLPHYDKPYDQLNRAEDGYEIEIVEREQLMIVALYVLGLIVLLFITALALGASYEYKHSGHDHISKNGQVWMSKECIKCGKSITSGSSDDVTPCLLHTLELELPGTDPQIVYRLDGICFNCHHRVMSS